MVTQEWRHAIGIAPLDQLKHMREITLEEIRAINLQPGSEEKYKTKAALLSRLRLIDETSRRTRQRMHRKQMEREGANSIARHNSGLSFSKMFVSVARDKLPKELFEEYERETMARLIQKERANGNK